MEDLKEWAYTHEASPFEWIDDEEEEEDMDENYLNDEIVRNAFELNEYLQKYLSEKTGENIAGVWDSITTFRITAEALKRRVFRREDEENQDD